ncbi:hypothetical protein [Streptomyces graminilatus]|uniref:hypothetical protein n=1 Tax=Streptomyces graminilatus TaxID=1464070 RepID=UPI0006E42850|nr:hypothetical protein [Streptomyces graminilatus]
MSEIALTVGLAGALLCLAGRLPGPVQHWWPQLLALGGMALMAGHQVAAGAWTVLAACLWSVVRACAGRRVGAEVIDLAAMAALMALMALMAGHADGSPAHMTAGMTADMAGGMAGGMTAGPAVLTAVLWVTARAGRIMFRQLSDRTGRSDRSDRSSVPKAVRSTPLVWVYRESGAPLMVIGMVAMLV